MKTMKNNYKYKINKADILLIYNRRYINIMKNGVTINEKIYKNDDMYDDDG